MKPNAGRQQQMVDQWNRRVAKGAPVNYRHDDGTSINTKTRTPAELLSGHTAVIWLDGVRGCVILDRVSPIVAGLE